MTTARKKRIYAWLYNPAIDCIFDIDLAAVYAAGPWIKVARLEYSHLRPSHPKGRLDWPLNRNHMHYVKNITDLPKWMRERIAILRIVPGVWVPDVGQCWDDRYYTFVWGKTWEI